MAVIPPGQVAVAEAVIVEAAAVAELVTTQAALDNMNHTNTIMVAIFVALGVMLVAGLVVLPATDGQAQAKDGRTIC